MNGSESGFEPDGVDAEDTEPFPLPIGLLPLPPLGLPLPPVGFLKVTTTGTGTVTETVGFGVVTPAELASPGVGNTSTNRVTDGGGVDLMGDGVGGGVGAGQSLDQMAVSVQ